MKKGIFLSIGALVLIGVIGFGIWYINETGKMRTENKDFFIPYNSAFVVTVNQKPVLPPEVEQAYGKEVERFRKRLLVQVTDSLRGAGYVPAYPYVLAARVEGKSDVPFLYVLDNTGVLSRGEVAGYLNRVFAGGAEKVRKYDRYKIYSLQRDKECVYFAVCGGIVLVSDSDLYIEDGLKQFDREVAGEEDGNRFRDIGKYFSAGAGFNVFMNTELFTGLLPLCVEAGKVFPNVDITRFFKWGTLDGDFGADGVSLNGFMQYGGLDRSYIRTFTGQQAREASVDGVVPAYPAALGLLNVSNPVAYFSALEDYWYSIGRKEKIFTRRQQYARRFGKESEEEWRKLLQGEFAMVTLSYKEAEGECDGLVIASLKSGSLGKGLLERMLGNYARFDGKALTDYSRGYGVDEGKRFVYYRFPVEDLPSVYWGYVFEGLKSRYVMVEDNYLVFATSEKAMRHFVDDYVHGSCVRDAEWYRGLKGKMAGKYNLAYFARTGDVRALYRDRTKGVLKEFIGGRVDSKPVFPAFAMQWSNEGEMLYHTMYLSTVAIQEEVRPHVLWQTRLDAKVAMKPVPVVNHNDGGREVFVQDEAHTVYLINDAGRILWKRTLEEAINSEVYQVDLFKNGKLQYLFSTPSRIYLIDRNGRDAGCFPLTLDARCEQGITVYDYDGSKEYRIFVPCTDRKVYLYGLDGKRVKGWMPRKADKPILTRVQHFRLAGKDYLVFADRYRLYVLDRRGQERVKVPTVFDLPEGMDIYDVRKNGTDRLLFAGTDGTVHLVDFKGNTESFQTSGLKAGFHLNAADINGDGVEECVFTDGDCLLVYDLAGKLMLEKKLEVQGLGFPYVYRFSDADIRVGLNDSVQGQMFLLGADGSMSKGFPIAGDSPFSIVFSGSDGFFLFAGADNGSLIKYKVQR